MSYQEFADRLTGWLDEQAERIAEPVLSQSCKSMEEYHALTSGRQAYLACKDQVLEVLHTMAEFERYEGAER